MTIDEKIRDEKLQYNINREAAKILVLPSGKVGKYEHLIGEEIVPLNQSQTWKNIKLDCDNWWKD